MAKKIKSTEIELPPHLSKGPQSLPIFSVEHPFFKDDYTSGYLEQSLGNLKISLGLEGRVVDVGDRLMLEDKDKNRVVQVYKPSHSFLYYDRSLMSTADPKFAHRILSPESAKNRASIWLEKQGYWLDNLVFEGFSYTGVTQGTSADPYEPSKQSIEKEYFTEVKACFGFQIGALPVFGPGAKVVVSFAGDTISQLAYFWRTPSLRTVGEMKIQSPEFVRKQLALDPRFSHLDPAKSKIRVNEITLGYYALPPFAVQRGYFPVYQVRGTVETRGDGNGYLPPIKKTGKVFRDSLRYDFNFFIPAGNMSPQAYKASGFPPPIEGSLFF